MFNDSHRTMHPNPESQPLVSACFSHIYCGDNFYLTNVTPFFRGEEGTQPFDVHQVA